MAGRPTSPPTASAASAAADRAGGTATNRSAKARSKTWAIRSRAPSIAAAVAGRASSSVRPSWTTVKRTSGRARAYPCTTSSARRSSVAGSLRNLRRAGTLKNSEATSTVVPRARAAGSATRTRPPSMRTRCPSPPLGGGQLDPRHRRDRGERLAAEAEGADALEVVEAGDLAGGVAVEGEQGVVAPHPRAVVGDDDPPLAAGLQLDPHRGGAGVEGVLHQLLDHRGGALHHLAGGDLADQVVGEEADAGHREIIVRRRQSDGRDRSRPSPTQRCRRGLTACG